MISLPVKYRPQTFNDVVGQESVIKVLQKQVDTNSIKNSYLFCGQSGGGKTTCARIFANVINGGIGEPIEIDAASNNGVDSIRALVQESKERALNSRYKVFIIDEVHVLTNQSWQALLKTLEEPSDYTVFILCTTDPQKIPQTILNRVQRFNFNKIPPNLIKGRLQYVCEQEHFVNYDETIDYISKTCSGCMREALSILGKIADYNTTFDINNTISILGEVSIKKYVSFINACIDGNEKEVLYIIDEIENSGTGVKLFVDRLFRFVLDVSKYIIFNTLDVTTIPNVFEADIKNIINFDSPINYYNYVMSKLLELKNMLKNDTDSSSTVRVVCLQIARMQ